MPVVFINYRVREQPGYATLLYRDLTQRFGENAVFMAARSIRVGDNYVDAVFDNLRQCEVMLVVMGSRWLESARTGPFGFDWVHREIAAAFGLGLRVVPVLIEDAEVPDPVTLSTGIAALARCQFVRLRHYSLDIDLAHLAAELRQTTAALRQLANTTRQRADNPRLSRRRYRTGARSR